MNPPMLHLLKHEGPTDAEITAALKTCERCGKTHPRLWHHKGDCTWRDANGYCPEPALVYGGKSSLLCAAHSAERP